MNENWPEIVETLIPYFETNSVEGDYQREIENCLKFLGWKKTNGCCGLYIYKDLYFTSALYGLYSIIAIFGYFKWKKIMNMQ